MSTELLTTLKSALGPDEVLDGATAGERYRVDFSHENACAPLAVLRPRSTEEVATMLRG